MKQSLALREYVQGKNLNLLGMIPLDIEPWNGFHEFSNLEVEISEAGISYDLSLAIVYVEIDIEHEVIEILLFSHAA